MAIKASEIIQAAILADQLFSSLFRLIREAKEIDGADEPGLKSQLAALRKRNDERFTEVDALLTERAGGT